MLNIPNQITLARILLVPVFLFILVAEFPYQKYIAALFFLVLSFSDALDGYLARKYKQVTNLGKLLDPIADKFLIVGALIFLVPAVPLWMVAVIAIREIGITVLRLAILHKQVLESSLLGKSKTVIQVVAITWVILELSLGYWVMLVAVLVTIVSGIDYLRKLLAK